MNLLFPFVKIKICGIEISIYRVEIFAVFIELLILGM